MSLSKEIIENNNQNLARRLELGANSSEYDPYGYNPLIISIMTDNVEAFDLLVSYGADINQVDVYGHSPMQWAVRCENHTLIKRLCKHKATIQSTTMEQEPLLAYPLLRKQKEIVKTLKSYGCKVSPAEDYILHKSLGHYFELHGLGLYKNHNNILTLFEYQGFKLEFALTQLYYHWQLYKDDNHWITKVIHNAVKIRTMKTLYRNKHQEPIKAWLESINFFPIAFEGHAISVCHSARYLAVIDRSHGPHQPLEVYKIQHPPSVELSQEILFSRKDRKFIPNLIYTLGGELLHSYSLPRQVIGNCTWANLEVAPAVLELLKALENRESFNQMKIDSHLKLWRTWSQEFIFKSALLKAATLDGDRQKALVYTLTHILTHSDLSKEMVAKYKNLVIEKKLTKYVQLILEIYAQQDYLHDKVNSISKML